MNSFSNLFWGRHTQIFITLLMLSGQLAFGQLYNDVSIGAFSSTSSAIPGDTVSFFIQVKNEGQSNNTGLSVKTAIPSGTSFWLAIPPIGTTYDPVSGIWQIGNALGANIAELELELKVVILAEGVIYLQAEVWAQNEMDIDSEPGNGFLPEDDMATSCLSIPYQICTSEGETVTMEAPDGFSGYEWFREDGNGLVAVGTGQVYTASLPGSYTFMVNTSGCPTGLCCPVIVEESCGQYFDLSLAKTLAPGQPAQVDVGDEIHYLITVTNEGNIAVSNILISDFISPELVPGNNSLAWDVSTPGMAQYTIAGPLLPGASASVEIVLAVRYGASSQWINNMAEVAGATDSFGNPITDIDSTPNNGDSAEDDMDQQGIQLLPHDPTGYLYCENTGELVTGGSIAVTGPGEVFIVSDGSTGYYEFYTDGTPGNYQLVYTPPANYTFSQDCLPQPGAIDPTGMADPVVLGADTANLLLTDVGCQANPYYLSFNLQPGDPFIFNNNIPLVCPQAPTPQDTLLLVYNCGVTDPFFCMDIPYAKLGDYGFEVNGSPYTGEFGTCDYLRDRYYSYGALLAAGGQGPYLLEDWNIAGNNYTVDFQTIEELVAWMNQWDIFGTWTIDETTRTISGGNPQIYYSKMTIRQLSNSTEAILELYQQFTANSTYLNLPEGNNMVVVTNLLTAEVDSFNLRVVCVTPDFVEITMPVGTLDTICLSTEELEGEVSGVFSACGESIITAADLAILPSTVCVEVVALEPGETDACYVICDDAGICDTTYIHVTVIDDDFALLPDSLCTTKNIPITGEVLLNDIIPDSIVSMTILAQPQNGSVILNGDGTINYVPEEDYCNDDGPLDQFSYQVCTAFGCQSTLVFVKVSCDGLIVYNGFSPNGDGVNDFFKIDGIGAYPNHNIMVFNRWGNKVFQTKNYRNDWDGYWQGKRLPFGTYFYLIDLGDGSKWLSGYLQIWW
ncbi:MAG: gliding motility-associated C-terminal domain-containing protein [Saprospiraceae bacterium]